MLILVNATALSVAANATSSEQISTSTYQFIPYEGDLILVARGSATGLNASFAAAGQTLCNDQPLAATGTAGAISVFDHEVARVGINPGARAELKFRNTTGGALTVDYYVGVELAES